MATLKKPMRRMTNPSMAKRRMAAPASRMMQAAPQGQPMMKKGGKMKKAQSGTKIKNPTGSLSKLKDIKIDNSSFKKLFTRPSSDTTTSIPKQKKGGSVKKQAKGGMHKMPNGSMIKNSMMKKGR